MITYSYHCENCDNRFEVVCKVEDYSEKQKCPACKKTENVYRDFQTDSVTTNMVPMLSECKTLQQYAEKQTKIYGEEKCSKMRDEFHKYKKKENRTGGVKLGEGMTRVRTKKDLEGLSSPLTREEAKKKRKR